ncbi:Helix-turn-helix domain protein [compost metagenome]
MNGKTIQAIRLANGLTQREFAERIGVVISTLAMVEAGHRKVTDSLRFKIARHFPIDETTAAVIENAKKLEGMAE